MKRRSLCCFVMIVLHMVNLVSATSRALAPATGPSPQPFQFTLSSSKQGIKGMEGEGEMSVEAYYKGQSKIGSRPPSCENKCYGCTPCEAIQVPTTTNHLGVQYANYEPEGWKCKCGPSFYSP
ncbi:EPIDERMAL PATTERNING FACTOR-like protein 2 [Vitis riparia]|uniref:EPIDERMAL PATTERNING FACTOR-like protein 2 n=1 Tax=Vitis riparia TaxID=96939 RepID=UPI00155B3FC6|nr:EPIDERMAL PATTERNING FACTOR-like protein 2 [Vitis riparia]